VANRQITVYWSSTWQSCHAAKEFLSSHGLDFTAKNVADDATARDELIARTGRMAVPVITVDDEVVVGFDRGRLQRLLGIRWCASSAALTVARS
jgi:glutaredoxin 3